MDNSRELSSRVIENLWCYVIATKFDIIYLMNTKRWVRIFKGFSNENRVGIVRFLFSGKKPRTVTEISEHLGISLKATSRHLIILEGLEVLESKGSQGHVFYSINSSAPADVQRAMNLFLL